MVSRAILTDLENTIRKTGRRLLSLQPMPLQVTVKADNQLATNADAESHILLREWFANNLSDLPLVMEEQKNPEELPDTFAVCDELDGTTIYAHGHKQWGIAVALIECGTPAAGFIFFPAIDLMLSSRRHQGVFANGTRLSFSCQRNLQNSLLGFELNKTLAANEVAWLLRLMQRSRGIRNLGVTTGSILELLQGQTDAFLNLNGGKLWDFAAAALMVAEAGGFCADDKGLPLVWTRIPMKAVFASSRNLAEELYRNLPSPANPLSP